MLSRLNNTRNRQLSAIAAIWLVAVSAIFAFTGDAVALPEEPVVVTHWVSSHLMRKDLLPQMAAQFNLSGPSTQSGRPVVVEVHDVPPALQAKYLLHRVKSGIRYPIWDESGITIDPNISDPTIVTPSSAHWFVTVNHEAGEDVVDLAAAQSVVRPFIGIVTYRDMAICLGWPEKDLGYADILALRADPAGWDKYPSCAKLDWGSRPLVAYTDPTTSSTGRSLLLGLYAIAAGKSPEELSLEDVNDPRVVDYIKEFQGLIDHYSIGTTVLNTKIHQGPQSGHFFIMPEDNLIHLYEGTEEAYINGEKVTAPPIEPGSMVMIYPKEGAMPRNNCACIVNGSWVTDEHREASQKWIDFILEDEQQRAFMAAGFRPGGELPLTDSSSKIDIKYGLDAEQPTKVINPSLMKPVVAAAIDKSWEDVKKPGIVTFVLDTSSSMKGSNLQEARDGVELALNNMAKNNQVGLVIFNDTPAVVIPVFPLMEIGRRITDAVNQSRAQGDSALYDAIKTAIALTNEAPGDAEAIRGVVVLTDGKNTTGDTRLHDLIVIRSRLTECLVREVLDEQTGTEYVDQCTGSTVDPKDVTGVRSALKTNPDIQIFFIGIGEDADIEVARMLAEATGAEYVVTTDEALAKVIERFGKYF